MRKKPKELNFFQTAALNFIASCEDEEASGISLRKWLAEIGYKKSPQGFSDAMQRLEKYEYIESRYRTTQLNGHNLTEKLYKLREEGRGVLTKAQKFLNENCISTNPIKKLSYEFGF